MMTEALRLQQELYNAPCLPHGKYFHNLQINLAAARKWETGKQA